MAHNQGAEHPAVPAQRLDAAAAIRLQQGGNHSGVVHLDRSVFPRFGDDSDGRYRFCRGRSQRYAVLHPQPAFYAAEIKVGGPCVEEDMVLVAGHLINVQTGFFIRIFTTNSDLLPDPLRRRPGIQIAVCIIVRLLIPAASFSVILYAVNIRCML